MGHIVIEGDEITYQQVDGETTARLVDFKEKMELSHQGSPKFKRIFYLLVTVGIGYLGLVFLLY